MSWLNCPGVAKTLTLGIWGVFPIFMVLFLGGSPKYWKKIAFVTERNFYCIILEFWVIIITLRKNVLTYGGVNIKKNLPPLASPNLTLLNNTVIRNRINHQITSLQLLGDRCCPTAALVLPTQRWGIQQSAETIHCHFCQGEGVWGAVGRAVGCRYSSQYHGETI